MLNRVDDLSETLLAEFDGDGASQRRALLVALLLHRIEVECFQTVRCMSDRRSPCFGTISDKNPHLAVFAALDGWT